MSDEETAGLTHHDPAREVPIRDDGPVDADSPQPVRLGRKRDHTRDAVILDAVLEVLAEVGYEGMTVDMVAARARAGKGTLYRRWPSKAEMVLEAVDRMKGGQMDPDRLLDTGTLRGDLLAMMKPEFFVDGEHTLKVMAGLTSLLSQDQPELVEAVNVALHEPWAAALRVLIRRAADRGEIPAGADIETLAHVMPSMAAYRVLVRRRPVDRHFLLSLIDGVLLPALRPEPIATYRPRPIDPHDPRRSRVPAHSRLPSDLRGRQTCRPSDWARPRPDNPTPATKEPTMSVTTTTHLNFRGNAREALEFYHSVFGGQLMIGTYGEGGVPQDSPDSDNVAFVPVAQDSPDAGHVSFGTVAGENGFRLAAYDVFGATGGGIAGSSPDSTGRANGLTHTEALFVLLNGDTLDEVTKLWEKLSGRATVIQALAPTPWGAPYGMLTDRFGVTWIVGVATEYAAS